MFAVIILIDETETAIDGRDVEGVQQMPLGSAEVVGETMKQEAVGDIVKLIIATPETLVSRLQEVFVLIDHAQTENALHGDDELRLQHSINLI